MNDEPETPACSARPCDICHEPAHTPGEECDAGDDCPTRRVHLGRACRKCYERMARQLRDLPELYVWAGRELTPGATSSGTRSTEPGIGVRVSALDLRTGFDVLGALHQWERDWRETFEDPALTVPPRAHRDRVGANLVAVCGWLGVNLIRSCRAHPAIDVFAQELNDLHQAASIAARVTGRGRKRVDCPAEYRGEDGEWHHCGTELRVDGLDLSDVVYCRQCKTRWEVHRLLLVVANDTKSVVWLSLDEVSLLLGIPARTLKRWAKQGRIVRERGLYDYRSTRDAIRSGTRRVVDT